MESSVVVRKGGLCIKAQIVELFGFNDEMRDHMHRRRLGDLIAMMVELE
jgi:hypothetical protein